MGRTGAGATTLSLASPPRQQQQQPHSSRSTISQLGATASASAAAAHAAPSVTPPTPGLPLHHPHAPPPSLSFHSLRYTLHQSFGTLAAQAEKDAAARQTARRKQEQLRKEKQMRQLARHAAAATATATDGSASARSAPASPSHGASPSARAGAEGLMSPSPPSSLPSGSATARPAFGRRRGRSRTRAASHQEALAAFEASAAAAARAHAPLSESATSRDVEYTRAVNASKYRREHHNSPHSHWHRLRENIQQRYTQSRALCSMAYFAAEGNLFQSGAALEAEEKRRARDRRTREDMARRSEENGAEEGKDGSSGGSATARRNRAAASSPLSLSDAASTMRAASHLSHAPRSIHEGQLLRQVANIQLPVSSEEGAPCYNPLEDDEALALVPGANGGATGGRSTTKRAELLLARAYADFDLAKRDLKERLYESLALQDSERARTLHAKYAAFEPSFEDAERDLLSMRVAAERRRHRVLQQRMDNLEALEALVQFINQQNGGHNGEQTSGADADAPASAAAAGGSGGANAEGSRASGGAIPLPVLGSDLTAPGPSGLVGFSHGASLPSFEEIYVVEVLAALIDSGVPLCAHHPHNKRVTDAIEARRRAAEVGQMPLGSAQRAAAAAAAAAGGATASSLPSRRGSVTSVSTNATSSAIAAAASRGGLLASTSSSVVAGLAASGSPLADVGPGVTGSSLSAAAAASASLALTPPPSLLLLLLCLSRDLFRLKEVRELLERWVRLTGTQEEVLDAALRMIGVDPREPLYSAKAAKSVQSGTAAGGSVAAGESAGAASATAVGPNGQPLLFHESSGLSGLLDASTKAALMHSTAMGLLQSPGSNSGGSGVGGAGAGGAGGAGSAGVGAWPHRRPVL